MQSILSATTNNKLLMKADPISIIRSSLVAAYTNLSIDTNLGQAALVPYGGVVEKTDREKRERVDSPVYALGGAHGVSVDRPSDTGDFRSHDSGRFEAATYSHVQQGGHKTK